jgi:DNA-directed RNA polymerase specialized sigma24 family protein
VYSIYTVDIQAAARQQLAEILEDPRIRGLAMRYAGHPALADDALQSTYYAVARLEHLGQIQNLRAYVCKALIREIHRERSQLGAIVIDDFARIADEHQDAAGCHPAAPPSVEDAVCTSAQAEAWLERFAAQRNYLRAGVPARSADPDRYRAVICDAAGQLLYDGINGEPSEADTNPALRAAYPEYFNQPDAEPNTLHQRFCRARTDVRALLQAVVRRDELT